MAEKTAKKATESKAAKAKATKVKAARAAAKPKAKATGARAAKAKATKAAAKPKAKAAKAKASKSGKKAKDDPVGDMGIVIVDDDLTVDREKINEERRAYLEEARSQEAFD